MSQPHVRNLQEKTTYAAIFRGNNGNRESYLQVAQLDGWDFTAESLTASELDKMKGSDEETHPIYSVDSRSTSAVSGRHCPANKKDHSVDTLPYDRHTQFASRMGAFTDDPVVCIC